MRMIVLIYLTLFATVSFGQLTYQQASDSLRQYHLGNSTYFEDFNGYPGYGAGVITTRDGGAAGFGDGDNGLELIKLDKNGKVQWRASMKKKFEEVEAQCVVEDIHGNFYVFMLNYNPKGYRGGCENVICFTKEGKQLWDKLLGQYTLLNRPTVSYVQALPDGRIEMRGHIVIDKQVQGKDPVYRFWDAWLDAKGTLIQKVNQVIDWKNNDWKKRFTPVKKE